MRNFQNKFELNLFLLFLSACLFLLISAFQFPVVSFFSTKLTYDILTNEKFKLIGDGFSLSLIAAYIFYVFSNLIPDIKKKRSIKNVLNTLVASVLDSYKRERIFGHETAISHIDTSCLSRKWIEGEIVKNKERNSGLLSLKFSLETAHSRIHDFRNVLPLAVNLSPDHAFDWLVIIDKVRLLVDEYEMLISAFKEIEKEFQDREDFIALRKSEYFEGNINSYRFRFLEFLEVALNWIEKDDFYKLQP